MHPGLSAGLPILACFCNLLARPTRLKGYDFRTGLLVHCGADRAPNLIDGAPHRVIVEMRVFRGHRRRCMAQKPANDGEPKPSASADRSEAMAKIVKAQPFEPGGLRNGRPWAFEIGARRSILLPGIIKSLPSRRGSAARTSRAPADRNIDFLPVFEVGKFRSPRSKSTYSRFAVRISRRRAPVRVKRRIAATANGSSLRYRFARAVAYRMPGSPYTNWFVVAFLVLVAVLLSLDEGTRIALYVAPVWFTILGIGYQIAKPRAVQVA
jgi:hypothetical protein